MVDSPVIIFVIGAIIAAVIILMSLVFLFKAARRAKAIGMDKKVVTETIRNSAIFSIVPSIPIVIGVGIMMQFLGLAIPWIRLTVIGALQYEMLAMSQAGVAAGVGDAVAIATAVVIMTIAILTGPLFNAIFYKKLSRENFSRQSVVRIRSRDRNRIIIRSRRSQVRELLDLFRLFGIRIVFYDGYTEARHGCCRSRRFGVISPPLS